MRTHKPPPFKNKVAFAVMVDGECELWYIQMLKRNERTLSFDPKPRIPGRKKLEDQYKSVIDLLNDYDKAFWIIDCDVIASESRIAEKGAETEQQKLEKYIRKLKKDYGDRAVVIRNNPCLEYWLLLHFEKTTAAFNNCDEAGKKLKKHLAAYEKTQDFYTKQNKDIYLQFKPNLLEAIKRAREISNSATDDSSVSISQMHLLFEELGLAEKEK